MPEKEDKEDKKRKRMILLYCFIQRYDSGIPTKLLRQNITNVYLQK